MVQALDPAIDCLGRRKVCLHFPNFPTCRSSKQPPAVILVEILSEAHLLSAESSAAMFCCRVSCRLNLAGRHWRAARFIHFRRKAMDRCCLLWHMTQPGLWLLKGESRTVCERTLTSSCLLASLPGRHQPCGIAVQVVGSCRPFASSSLRALTAEAWRVGTGRPSLGDLCQAGIARNGPAPSGLEHMLQFCYLTRRLDD